MTYSRSNLNGRAAAYLCLACVLCSLIGAGGCWTSSEPEVIVYSALDRDFSEPLFQEFTEATGIRVRAKYDTESTKTVGLTNAIIAESARPRCDLFWNNEILNTLRLEKLGLLDAHKSSAGEQFPAEFRATDASWYGFAARARVLIVNNEIVPAEQRPTSIQDLIAPQWKGRVGVAKPLFGTTATHAACLFAAWGDERASEYFRALRQNAQVLAGNKQVALAVARGQLAFGLTDTDDAIIELEKGLPVEIVYPDQGQDQPGTLFIPNTVALVKGSAHSAEARQLREFLLSPAVEARLAVGRSAQIPLNPQVTVQPRVQTPRTIKPMLVDYSQAADKWQTAAEFLRDEFASAE